MTMRLAVIKQPAQCVIAQPAVVRQEERRAPAGVHARAGGQREQDSESAGLLCDARAAEGVRRGRDQARVQEAVAEDPHYEENRVGITVLEHDF